MNLTHTPLILALLASMALPTAAARADDEVPCEHLRGERLKAYNQLIDLAAERFGEKSYSRAIEAILELRKICSEDPRIEYNLARAYQRDENCNMARYWYEEVLDRDETSFGALVKEEKFHALTSLTELEQICVNSTRVAIECADPEFITIQLGDELEGETCPTGARIDAGQMTLTATRPGHLPFTLELDLRPREINRVFVPLLQPEAEEARNDAVLQISCDGGLGTLSLTDGGGQGHAVDCLQRQEHSLSIAPGPLSLTIANRSETRVLDIEPGAQVSLNLLETAAEAEPISEAPAASSDLRLGGWIALGGGLGLVAAGTALHLVALSQTQAVLVPGTFTESGIVTNTTQVQAQADLDDAATLDTVAAITASVGGAALLTGLVLLIVDAEADAEPAVSARLTRDSAVFLFQRSF